jgi:hypothetical protein
MSCGTPTTGGTALGFGGVSQNVTEKGIAAPWNAFRIVIE